MTDRRTSTLARGGREAIASLWLLFVRHLPGTAGVVLRRRYWGRRLASLGDGVRMDEGVRIMNPDSVHIGSRCWIAAGVLIAAGRPSLEDRDVVRRENPQYGGAEGEVRLADDVEVAVGAIISGSGGVQVGENVSLGPNARLFSASNHYRGPDGESGVRSAGAGMRRGPGADIDRQSLLVGPVVVGREAFVGTGAVVLPGVTVGERAWIGAGVVARRSVDDGALLRSPEPVELDPEPTR